MDEKEIAKKILEEQKNTKIYKSIAHAYSWHRCRKAREAKQEKYADKFALDAEAAKHEMAECDELIAFLTDYIEKNDVAKA